MDGNKKVVKSSKSSKKPYICECCHYTTSRKHNYNKHISTRKHLKLTKGNFRKPKETKKGVFICHFCEKIFKSKSGRWKHLKKCGMNPTSVDLELKKEKEKNLILKKQNDQLMKERLENKIQDLKNQLKVKNVTNITNNNCKQININVYLNEDCKDAIPIMDFIKGLQFQLNDIDPDCPNSTIHSLQQVVIDGLQKLEDTERPIHCSDTKRMKFYVKDASGWEKDVDHCKIDKALGYANIRQQGFWCNKAINENLAEKKDDNYYLKMNVAMGTWSDNPNKSKQKIKREISKITKINP